MESARLVRRLLVLGSLVACAPIEPPTASGTATSGIDLGDATTDDGTSSDGAAGNGEDASSGELASTETGAYESTDDGADATTQGGVATTGGDIVPCDVATATLVPVVPDIVLVLDKSGSMVANTWDHDANAGTPEVTRWSSLVDVVETVVVGFDDRIAFGAVLFPAIDATGQYNASACVVADAPDVPVAEMNHAAILGAIPDADALDIHGGTPATAGFTVAHDHLLAQGADTPRAIVLVTDGAANCSADAANDFERFEVYDDQLPEVVGAAWTDDGIPTYVVGIDILDTSSSSAVDGNPDATNTFAELNVAALAGGVPTGGAAQFYQTTNQVELGAALQSIVDEAIGCTVPLDPVPAFPDLLEVYVDGVSIPPASDCATEDGWVFATPDGPYDAVELCGSFCETLVDVGAIDVEYYCTAG